MDHGISEENRSRSDSLDEKKGPEEIVYAARAASTGSSKEAATGKDGEVDPESAGMFFSHFSTATAPPKDLDVHCETALIADKEVNTPLQLVTKTLDAFDNPNESPYTLRAFVIGLGLSAFGAVIAEIFYFKPQTVLVNPIFLVGLPHVIRQWLGRV
jgi:hypothetical protein